MNALLLVATICNLNLKCNFFNPNHIKDEHPDGDSNAIITC